MTTRLDDKATFARTKLLAKRHSIDLKGVVAGELQGAYLAQPKASLEYLLHEIAHMQTLGCDLKKLPKDVPLEIEQKFSGISDTSGNSLEMDTALVTFLALRILGWEENISPIATSCWKNLRYMSGSVSATIVELENRRASNTKYYEKTAQALAAWFLTSRKS